MLQVYELWNGNKVLFDENVTINKKNLLFDRETSANNILLLVSNLDLGDSVLTFNGRNSVVFLNPSLMTYNICASIYSDQVLYIGVNNYMNLSGEPIRIMMSEQKHVFIGSEGVFASDIRMRNADPHLIYSMETHRRVNPSRSIFIGDHVWLGERVTLLKGTQIGSGSIVGAGAVVSGKKIPSNESWAGNPARRIGKKIFWSHESVHAWEREDTMRYETMDTDEFTYAPDAQTMSFDEIDRRLSECRTADEKLNYLVEVSKNTTQNRFAI